MKRTKKEQLEMVIQQFKELTGIYRGAVSHTGISENEFWIWYTLIITGEAYSQQDICSAWSLSKQTVNTIIAHMVQKGYAFLETAPGAGNRKNIRLTESGRQYGKSIVPPVCTAEERALNHLSPEELAACTDALGKFINILKEEINDTQQE